MAKKASNQQQGRAAAKKTQQQTQAKSPASTEVAATAPGERELTNLQGRNYYEQFGDAVTQRAVAGKLLKFSKGDYYAGQDQDEVALGTRVVVVMTSLETGWIKWVDNKPEQMMLGLVGEGHVPPKRSELGDTDEALWEVDEQTGNRRDPWQLTSQVVMQPLDWEGDDDDLFTFVTQSRGGLNAVGALSKAYGAKIRTEPGVFPVVELGADSYMHPNKQFGRIKIPQLTVVEWVASK